MSKKSLLALALFLTLALSVFSQQAFIIEGKVTDTGGEPLPGVNIVINGTSYGAATDLNGQYLIRNVPAGRYTLSALYVGYETLEKSVEAPTIPDL